jgi:hypothetical protein
MMKSETSDGQDPEEEDDDEYICLLKLHCIAVLLLLYSLLQSTNAPTISSIALSSSSISTHSSISQSSSSFTSSLSSGKIFSMFSFVGSQ